MKNLRYYITDKRVLLYHTVFSEQSQKCNQRPIFSHSRNCAKSILLGAIYRNASTRFY